eukprot:6322476-Alexandrium_andersonii.AAC.1
MSASLVGSEMCIRDSMKPWRHDRDAREPTPRATGKALVGSGPANVQPVSYTHLTLPTICSV